MSEDRKWPFEESKSRPEATLPSDLDAFSIETTTMRLKSLKLERQEKDLAAFRMDQAKKEEPPKPVVKSVWLEPKEPGRVRHDDRGMAVFELAVATGEFATLSSTNVMRKLDAGGLSIEETQRELKAIKPLGRDVGGGGDPYNQRGGGQRPGEAAKRQGVTGSPDRKPNNVLDQLTGKK